MSKARILVIDDDQMIRNSLMRILNYEGFEVFQAEDGEKGLGLQLKESPDLVILDVAMPGMSGIDVCRRIKLRSPAIPVLFLSAKDEIADRVAGLENGGDDYLIKPFAFEELLARIAVLLRRKLGGISQVMEYEGLSMDDRTKKVKRDGVEISFSATEYQVLRYFLSCPEQVLSKDQILEHVWGPDYYADLNLVEVYIRYIRTKLEASGGKRLIHTVRGSGYSLRSEP
ncbi:MAG: response regulator transcription factor [Spirochaetota bacterium]